MKDWNQEELTAFLDKKSSGLVYVYTPLCGTCQMAAKMLRVANEIVNFTIGRMNLNFFPQLAVGYEIESVPCLLFIKEGKIADKIYAFHSVPYLIGQINSIYKTDA